MEISSGEPLLGTLSLQLAAEGDQDFTSSLLFSSAISDYCIEAASRHIFKCPPVPSVAFWREPIWTDRTPGPGTYTLPRLIGPNTAYTSASPCYSLTGRSQHGRFDDDLAKTPGPVAFPRVAVDAYRTHGRPYSMGGRPKPGAAKAAKPGPADYSVGRGVTLIKPQAPACTFGIRHSMYITPLITE
ncbi:LOW QUALITY PROTEIN: ciliary microtubule associated protein 1A-like [Cyrtonyx montezumae]|uniref:LOW QUALITY PROTEIN: ciliary microtubule associated protein 1A-like n=1 Tax=Cyrtonyx montezumae TaxID=9017 RepID=UPI0032DA5AAD